MKLTLASLITLLIACYPVKINNQNDNAKTPVAIVIHGGAGTILKANMTPEKEEQYRASLKQALQKGYAVLEKGGTSVEAVLAAITVLEDDPLFNAGKGAVFTYSGEVELDASIMDGSNLQAGAVAGAKTIRNPILAAHAVMTKSPHVMLAGSGAEEFARLQNLAIVPQSYFIDSARYEQHFRRKKAREASPSKHGTVGAVALDRFGNIAAGTSTGGMMDKRWGRIGDSPVIGAGTWAQNKTCGISSTGWGEYFIRLGVAHDISAMMEYGGLSLQEAADSVIMKKLTRLGGTGGVIGLDQQSNITMTFNTAGMYRGYVREGEESRVFLFGRDEEE